MDKSKIYKKYCTGCGLCHSVVNTELTKSINGFIEPITINENDLCFMNKICMVSGTFWDSFSDYDIWGNLVEKPLYAYSNSPDIRKKASSGGVVSEIAIFLLENHYVDAVIEVKSSTQSVIETEVSICSNRDEIINCTGSRYTISSPLYNIVNLIDNNLKYVFIGKPCDVLAVRNWMKIDSNVSKSIVFLISFLCAGIPSKQAEDKLLSSLNTNEKDCNSLIYRGNGWPGYTVAYSNGIETGHMSYEESWGKILGRDVATSCRFCFDGIGEGADISCGDGWYIKDGKPDFSEHQGRNVVFIRSSLGKKIIESMINTNSIVAIPSNKIFDELSIIQNYQYIRRITMREKILALKVLNKPAPLYSKRMMRKLGRNASLKQRCRIFIGTIRRIYQKKI